MKGKFTKLNVILILVVLFLVVSPVFLITDSEFGGADGEAENIIAEINANYEPWFKPFWEPPGGETESLLFSLQAAIGSGALFFCLGTLKGKKQALAEKRSS